MTKSEIIAECRANPDKIFHLLRENDFKRAKKLFGEKVYPYYYYCNRVWEAWNVGTMHQEDFESADLAEYEYEMQQLILAPDVLGYLEEHGKEGE